MREICSELPMKALEQCVTIHICETFSKLVNNRDSETIYIILPKSTIEGLE